jgi:hypothetical protein
MMITARIVGLDRLTRILLDNAMTLALDAVTQATVDAAWSSHPAQASPPIEPPPAIETLTSRRRTRQ